MSIQHYAYAVAKAMREAMREGDKRTLGRRLVIYAGMKEVSEIAKGTYRNSVHRLELHSGQWYFMGCEIIEVRRESYFELGFKGEWL